MTTTYSYPDADAHGRRSPGANDEGRSSREARATESRAEGEPVQEAGIVIIDRRTLSRECLAMALRAAASGAAVFTFSTVEEWLAAASAHPAASIVLLCIGGRKVDDEQVNLDLAQLTRSPRPTPVILLSDIEDIDQILGALDNGAQGYIPTSVTLDVAIEAMRLVKAGGLYVPASSLLLWRRSVGSGATRPKDALSEVFTSRQAAVLRALREGKANKLIAYELNMRESTVKVHVRNIMKKLKAKNRTEVAFKANNLLMVNGIHL
jgi:DNA-binding NarL/FixJ family response regulator